MHNLLCKFINAQDDKFYTIQRQATVNRIGLPACLVVSHPFRTH